MNGLIEHEEKTLFSYKVYQIQNLQNCGIQIGDILICKKVKVIPNSGIYILNYEGELLAVYGRYEKINSTIYIDLEGGIIIKYTELNNIVGIAIGGFYKLQ